MTERLLIRNLRVENTTLRRALAEARDERDELQRRYAELAERYIRVWKMGATNGKEAEKANAAPNT